MRLAYLYTNIKTKIFIQLAVERLNFRQMRLTENYNPAKFGEYVGLSGYFVSFCLKTRKCLFTIYDTLKKKTKQPNPKFYQSQPLFKLQRLEDD